MHTSRFIPLLLIAFTLSVTSAAAQQKLDPEDYGQWQNITTAKISPNGNWFAYRIDLVEGNGWLSVKHTHPDSSRHKFTYGEQPEFSADSKWVAFKLGVSEEQLEKLEEQEKQLRYEVALMNLETMEVDTFTNIEAVEFSNSGRHVALKKYAPKESETKAADLILRDLSSGTNKLIGNVADYAFNKPGNKLAVRLDAAEQLGNGVHLYYLPEDRVQVIDSDTTSYHELSWNEEGTQLGFLKAREHKQFKEPTHLVHVVQNLDGEQNHKVFDPAQSPAFPDSFRVAEYRSIEWAEDNNTVFFGIQPWEPKPEPKDTVKSDLEPSNVEVWHWKDADIQPQQEVMADQNRRDTHLSAWHLEENHFVQLGTEMFEEVQLTGNQQHAVGYHYKPYEPAFEEDWRDIYLIDVQTGERKKILDRREYMRTSPDGNYLLYFKDRNWWAYDIADSSEVNLTGQINARFENFTNVNGREVHRPFGSGQWASDDSWVLVYDQYDAYKVWADGSKFKKVTSDTLGRIRYRQLRLEDEQEGIAPEEPVFFSIYGDTTKKRGYARLTPDNNFEILTYRPRQYSELAKADSASRYIFEMETAVNSPDFFVVGENFTDPVALTQTNPQQDQYHWAGDELITFTNEDGDTLQGRLLYPADYEEGEQYPMITYIYEERSQTLHNYDMPSKESAYNFRRYSSEGYFVFQPDISYELNDPGVSAVESVVPAVQKVVESGMVNPDQIGLTGHSWGAYQTTFIITQTNLFNSAIAGAPLTNMVSMYNSIYWNSGTTDAKIFETSQGRFEDPWWRDWDNYIENSPIFNAQKIDTPLMVAFGTEDGAVDFNQGVELYTTLRRMQKPFVMLVYEGANHHLAREENREDYATRAFQWHEHYLKGKEPANWIIEGLPYLERPAMQKKQDEQKK